MREGSVSSAPVAPRLLLVRFLLCSSQESPLSKWENKTYDAISVIVCLFTKFAIYEPASSTIDAESLAKTLYRHLLDSTMLKHIVNDRGSLFTSTFWSSLCHYLAVRCRLSTGRTERQNQTLECDLRNYVNFRQNDWARWIPLAQFFYNSIRHSVTGVAPAESLWASGGRGGSMWTEKLTPQRSQSAKTNAEVKQQRNSSSTPLKRRRNTTIRQETARHAIPNRVRTLRSRHGSCL